MPLMWSGSSGKSGGSTGNTTGGQQSLVSRFLSKTARRDERSVGVSELELGDTVRGSVQTQIGAGNFPIGTEGFSQYLPVVEFTGGNITLGTDGRAPWLDSIGPINPGIRVNTTTTRTMEPDPS